MICFIYFSFCKLENRIIPYFVNCCLLFREYNKLYSKFSTQFRLDRLGRSLKDLIDIINIFKNKGVPFKSISENIDTTTFTGNLIFHITGAFAEFERNIIRERVNTRLETVRARGKEKRWKTNSLITSEKIQMAQLLYNDKTLNIQKLLKKCRIIPNKTVNIHNILIKFAKYS